MWSAATPPKMSVTLRLRQRMRARDEVDVAYRALPADGQIEERRADPATEEAALERAAATRAGCRGSPRRAMFARSARPRRTETACEARYGIDPREDGRPKLVESERRMSADGHRRSDVSGLVEKNARRDAVA